MMRTRELFDFIRERHRIYQRKQAGDPKPWTNDPILQSYRFCNVYRELDTQTKWLFENWGNDDREFWFAALVFRFVNWHETAIDIGYPVPWDSAKFRNVIKRRRMHGDKVYSAAYMISTHGVRQVKHDYLANTLCDIWEKRMFIRYNKGELLSDFHKRLMSCFDVGSFLAAQVIADAKHFGEMKNAKDWDSFAASGPGSKRGLNRVCNFPLKNGWKEEDWKAKLSRLHIEINALVNEQIGIPFIDAQNLQNCLCEFDKYERTRLGEGRPRSRYKGGKDA